MATVVDASVVIAALSDEALSPEAHEVLAEGPLVSSANFAEVTTWLARRGDSDVARSIVESTNVVVVPLTEEMALRAGVIEPETKSFGLSLADRCCLATAEAFGARVYTADRAWLELPAVFSSRIVNARPH